ncbi:MAG: hypothetical protein KGL43_10235 [Burkholderiales bacterium]|nr:hypothetical protein [Burkholderiales bacterium]
MKRLALALAAALLGGPAALAGPGLLAGQWDVVRVAVDPADQPHWLYRPGDPRLLGRTFEVDSSGLRFDDAECSAPAWKSTRSTWRALLARTYPRPPSPRGATFPSPAQMGLGVNATAPIEVLRPRCQAPAGARVFPPFDDGWAVARADGRLWLRYEEALLTLEPRRADARPRASFDCHAAASPAERAICGDFSLAAWDRSVALAFREALARSGAGASALRAGQHAWLQQRERCESDKACLERTQRERVQALVQE